MHVILVNDVSFARGGATKVFQNCIEAALRERCAVSVLVGDDGKYIRERFPDVRVVALGDRPLRDHANAWQALRKTFNATARDALAGMLSTAPRDTVVHVHGWMQILSPSIFHALKDFSYPVFVTAHDFFLACPNGGFVDFPTSQVCTRKPMSLTCLVTNCDKRNYGHKLWRYKRMMVQHAAGREFWSRVNIFLAHEKMESFFEPTRFAKFIEMRSPVTQFVPGKIDAARNRTVTFLGRMTVEKGVDVLAEALSICDLPARFIGAGPLVDSVRERLPDAAVTGWVANEVVPDLIAQARVFVMPSRMPEPYGLVAVEAMKSGLPVVLSHNCLISEEVAGSGAGFAFDAHDADQLARILKRLDEDDELVEEMSERAYDLGHRFAKSPDGWACALVGHYRDSLPFTPQTTEEANLAVHREARAVDQPGLI